MTYKQKTIIMKKSILTIVQILMVFLVFSQTINDHKVTIKYIQLPTNPLPTSIGSFSVSLIKNYEIANEDSIAAYNVRLKQAKSEQESLVEIWNSDKKKIDKIYYAEMATWQKAVNAGNSTVSKPKDPIYPNYPYLKNVPLPILTEEVEQETISNKFNLNGYNKGAGGAVLTITYGGIQNAKVLKSIFGTGALTQYKYTANYKMPISIKLDVPGQGIVYENSFYTNEVQKLIKSEKSEYDILIWWMDNEDSYWKNIQTQLLNTALNNVNSELNQKFGFPVKSSSSEIYVVKKYKKHKYSEFVDALTYAKSGYDLLSSDVKKQNAKGKLNKSIAIWLDLLSDSNPSDSKSRINKKVTALLYANLAEAYLWMDDFDNADLYANKGITIGVLKYKNHCKRVQAKIGMLKSRYNANQ
jgi:hypothetical protein